MIKYAIFLENGSYPKIDKEKLKKEGLYIV